MSAQGEGDDGIVTGINVTPMVDITLVLLIVFMVTANFVSQQALKVNLPKTADAEAVATPSLTVVLNRKGEVIFREARTDLEHLTASLAVEAGNNPNARVTIAADEELPYKPVVAALEAVKKAGITRIAIATQR